MPGTPLRACETCGWKYRANIITAPVFRSTGGGGGSAQGAESRALGAQNPCPKLATAGFNRTATSERDDRARGESTGFLVCG